MSTMNRMATCSNPYQGEAKRVLCVCSAGLLRSPTCAEVLSREPFNFNTRAAGLVTSFALIPVDDVLIEWAQEIVCMEPAHAEVLSKRTDKPIVCLSVADSYTFRDPELQKRIRETYTQYQVSKELQTR